MKAALIAWALRFAVVAAAVIWGVAIGDRNRNNAWLAKQATVEREAHVKYEAEVKRGNDASGAFLVEHQTLQTNFQNLTEKFNGLSKRVPLLARNSAAVVSGCLSAPEVVLGELPPVHDFGYLTAGAVWMWNSALTGTDQPSGACGSLDTTEAACAAPTTASLDDAWANHRANAQLCAEDRLAHQRLIDFLTTKETK